MPGASLRERADAFQKRHRVLSFPFAVHKRFSEDGGKHFAASITYYAFFSLFPLLLSFVAVLGVVLRGRPGLRQDLINSALGQFPVIGTELTEKSIEGSGWTLALGLVAALWAGLGVVYAAQDAMDVMWDVPHRERPNFLVRRIRALPMLGVVAFGPVAGSAIAGLATELDELPGVARVATAGGTLAVNAATLLVGFSFLTVAKLPVRRLVPGAIVGSVALLAVQIGGAWYVQRVLNGAGDTYGTFATVIGLLTWLALHARITLYAAEINVVLHGRLWPRSLVGDDPLQKASVTPVIQ
jgi:YihY family inner membrane protein